VTSDDLPTQVLIVSAHPDDVDFGAAGTVACWTAQGVKVSYCIVTDGASGALDASANLAGLAAVRREEQEAAAAQVGVHDVHFLDYPDGRLEVTMDLRRDLSRVIRAVRPERIIAQSPERHWGRIRASHPDHLAAGEAVLRAVYPDARNPFAFPELLAEGFEPHAVDEVWLMTSPRSDRAVDITDVVELKIAALLCHKSQVGAGEHIEDLIRGWTSATAVEHGLGEGRYAEAFQVVETR
jgi:LmbE family N-acetylglucosaminyl deacetylase